MMKDGPNRIRSAAAEAVVAKLNEGASHEEISEAGIAAANAEYEALKREHAHNMDRIVSGERPGADNPHAILLWSVALLVAIIVLIGLLL